MQLTIDNLDGNGPVEYTPALVRSGPLTIHRQAGKLARCSALLDVVGVGLEVPAALGLVTVTSDAGVMLFAGVVTRTPLATTALQASTGEVECVKMEAAEAAWLRQNSPGASSLQAAALQPATSVTHAVSLEENAVTLVPTPSDELNLLAMDVTVSGAHEATTYATELFAGDGTTAAFALTETPFRPGTAAETLLTDNFDGSQFRSQVWTLVDPGQHLGFGSGGLQVSGGNGFDGQTVLQAAHVVEMGGTLTAELSGLTLQPGSDGVLLGMYSNIVTVPNCTAGFRVKGTAGAQTIVALINGAETGTPFTWATGHSYTLRLRTHSVEMQRVLGSYVVLVNGAPQRFGGALVQAPLQAVLEIQDLGLASSTLATVLYSGAIASSPARCVFAPVNSVDLLVQAGSCSLKQSGSAWVVSTLANGTTLTRREGPVDTGADFALSGSDLHFWPGRVPAANETVLVTYRVGARAFARVQNAAAIANAQLLGVPGWPEWTGAVTSPVPRSSADCMAAAQALLAFGGGAATGVAGTCTLMNAQQTADVQPGDQMALPAGGGAVAVQVPVERVTVTDGNAVPEVLRYEVAFAQSRANGLSFKTSGTLASDVAQPVPVSATSAVGNLQGLQVVSATATALQIDAGTVAPNGGGFEVRRRDGGFGTTAADLVLRSPVRSFSIPRQAFNERFYVRMYDGSLPPLYSARSSVVVTHLPTS